MTTNSTGQDLKTWAQWWQKSSVESEIKRWDFYGLRPWIVKFVCRHGKAVQAGCGLGRWTAYLSEFGIDIDGLDFSEETISELKKWSDHHNKNIHCTIGNVLQLPYVNNSIATYISLGVVEHFIEGPMQPLHEAFRVLRPGGIAIITTPSISWYVLYAKIRTKLKKLVKNLMGQKVTKHQFFQYEYRPKKLKKFVAKAGFKVTENTGADILFTFTQLGKYTTKYIQKGAIGYKLELKYHKKKLRNFGAQSICIGVKLAEKMHCFLCNEKTAIPSSLKKYQVPVCNKCNELQTSEYYKNEVITGFHKSYIINPPLLNPEKRVCGSCGSKYETDKIFEDYAFSKNVCSTCLLKKEVNIELSNLHLQPKWRQKDKEV